MPTWFYCSILGLVLLAAGCESSMIVNRCSLDHLADYSGKDFCAARNRTWWL
jgi:hypothetical protein